MKNKFELFLRSIIFLWIEKWALTEIWRLAGFLPFCFCTRTTLNNDSLVCVFCFCTRKKDEKVSFGKRIILLAWKEHALFTSLTHLAFLYLRMRVQWRTAVNLKIRIQVFLFERMHFLTNIEESNNATAWWHHLYLYLHSYAHFYGKHFDEWPNKYNED